MNCLPQGVAEDLIQKIGSNHICNVPVILVLDDIPGKPIKKDGTVLSGKFSESNAMSLRNHYEGSFLLVLPYGLDAGVSLTKSIELIPDPVDEVLGKLWLELLPNDSDLYGPLSKHLRDYSKRSAPDNLLPVERFWKVLYKIW